MSVPSWLRSEAKTKFLWKLYRLNIRIGEIVSNHPGKYRQNYGDMLIKLGLQALHFAKAGNAIFMHVSTPEDRYKERERLFNAAKSCVDDIPTIAYIYLELTRKADGVKADKIDAQEEEIGLVCVEIAKMLKGVMDNDRKVHSARFKGTNQQS